MRVRIAEEVQWRRAGDEIVILDPRSASYFSLNGTAAHLWPLLAGGATLERLSEELAAAFGVDRAEADRDVAAFVDGLRERRLVDGGP